MTLYCLDNLLKQILSQPQWDKQGRYHELAKCWHQINNPRVIQHTRPIYFRDEVLNIATSSSAWAQDLNLQRRSLLTKINRRVESPINDLRFASAQWYQNHLIFMEEEDDNKIHPSTIISESSVNVSTVDNSQEVLQSWLETIKKRALTWKTCPRCETSCPEGELKRWGCCAICFREKNSQFLSKITANE
ncbi:MAG: DUF721 domain-containing protein [Cyanobacteria bacterium]|nr:DUF721 domain-containing protein [Cyanobacteria bacterium CG_2015-09_32_10]